MNIVFIFFQIKGMNLVCPWNIESLEEFLFYFCPECEVKKQSRDDFLQHALKKHPTSCEYLKQFLSIKEEDYSISANNGLNSEKLEEEFEQFEDKYNLSEVENDFSHTVNDFINVVNDDLNINVNFQDPLGNTNGHLFPEICLFSRN